MISVNIQNCLWGLFGVLFSVPAWEGTNQCSTVSHSTEETSPRCWSVIQIIIEPEDQWNHLSLSPKLHFQRHLLIKRHLKWPPQSRHKCRILISAVRKGVLTETQTARALCLQEETERAKARGLKSRDAQAFLTSMTRAQCIIEYRGKGFGDPCPPSFRSHLPQWNQLSGFVAKTSQTQSPLELPLLLRGPMK